MRASARSVVVPQRLEIEEIRAAADAALNLVGWNGTIPVDIEQLLDARLGIDIVAVTDMKERLQADIEGFLSQDRRTIYVHQETHDHLERRLRFTLGHEWGHYSLHRELHDSAPMFPNFEDWRQFINSMPDWVRGRYEWQANMFAGMVLVPGPQLQTVIQVAKHRVRGPFTEIAIGDEQDRVAVVVEVARRFQVSPDVIERRGKAENLW